MAPKVPSLALSLFFKLCLEDFVHSPHFNYSHVEFQGSNSNLLLYTQDPNTQPQPLEFSISNWPTSVSQILLLLWSHPSQTMTTSPMGSLKQKASSYLPLLLPKVSPIKPNHEILIAIALIWILTIYLPAPVILKGSATGLTDKNSCAQLPLLGWVTWQPPFMSWGAPLSGFRPPSHTQPFHSSSPGRGQISSCRCLLLDPEPRRPPASVQTTVHGPGR